MLTKKIALPVTINTKFRIGSISKSVTGVGLSKMLEEGRMNLDSPVTSYVKYWPEKKYPITLRQLVSHTSGIRHYDYRKMEFLSRERFNSIYESVKQLSADTLLFQPGTKYSYSTFGYVLLSVVMERGSGKEFLNYMHDDVFIPLGMNNTLADYTDSGEK